MNHRGAVIALISEHEKAILELQDVIQDITTKELTTIVDNTTKNPDCKSIQTILSHVVLAGYSYNVYVRNFRKNTAVRPELKFHKNSSDYVNDLNNLICYTEETFTSIEDSDLERHQNEEKILTNWKQYYDIEQLMEHAIVHVLRHRRQIQNFLRIIRN